MEQSNLGALLMASLLYAARAPRRVEMVAAVLLARQTSVA
jgi:hypothetical protein